MPRLAIIGTGIAGLGCAHFLHRDYDITLFEQNQHAGGHANTIVVEERAAAHATAESRRIPIDTGFMVFNTVTYPQLTRLFNRLEVPVKSSPMSFSVRDAATGIEFCGSSLNHLFAQRRNLFRPRFYRMLRAIDRFNRDAVAALAQPGTASLTLGQYVRERGYGDDFLNLYLVPMSSAVWSTSPARMLGFPAATLLRFFHNHGFLGLHTQHPWFTVAGGARTYVEKITAPWRDRIRLGEAAVRVARTLRGVTVTTNSGAHHVFDQVVMACHGDQALRLLADPTPDESQTLGEFHYQPNLATLHTDTSVMPKTPLAWASWNYEINSTAAGELSPSTHYWMNSLQGVSDRENYFVSLNRPEAIDPGKVLQTIAYEHPLFTLGSIRAQAQLPDLNRTAVGTTETYFAGSYFRHGFHEDAFLSAVNLSGLLLDRDPWDRGIALGSGKLPLLPRTSDELTFAPSHSS